MKRKDLIKLFEKKVGNLSGKEEIIQSTPTAQKKNPFHIKLKSTKF